MASSIKIFLKPYKKERWISGFINKLLKKYLFSNKTKKNVSKYSVSIVGLDNL